MTSGWKIPSGSVIVTFLSALCWSYRRDVGLGSAYGDDHEGRWPETLDDLAPDYIEEDWVAARGFMRPEGEARERWDYFSPDVRDPYRGAASCKLPVISLR